MESQCIPNCTKFYLQFRWKLFRTICSRAILKAHFISQALKDDMSMTSKQRHHHDAAMKLNRTGGSSWYQPTQAEKYAHYITGHTALSV